METNYTLTLEYPAIINFEQKISVLEFKNWLSKKKYEIDEIINNCGALLIRNVDIKSLDDFQNTITNWIDSKSFLETNTSRTSYTSDILNASEYDATRKINLHTEFSHTNNYPSKLLFCCITPAAIGGETTIADNRVVTSLLSENMKRDFENKGVTYIRNLPSEKGVGTSWQHSFQTNNKSIVEKHCMSNNIDFSWNENDTLHIVQKLPAFRQHPISKEKLWFNHIDQFMLSFNFEKEIYDAMLMMHNNNVFNLPMHVTFGDNSSIPLAYLEELYSVFKVAEKSVRWRKGNILMVDNLLSLHGRMPYKGARKILVSMC